LEQVPRLITLLQQKVATLLSLILNQREACAARGGWHVAAGCGWAVGQRLNTEFLISAAEFIDISTAKVRIF
jgi:hypothetical protein